MKKTVLVALSLVGLFPALVAMATENQPYAHIKLDTETYKNLYSIHNTQLTPYQEKGIWIMYLKREADDSIDVGIWLKGGTFKVLKNLGAREGVSSIGATAISNDGILVFKGLFTPTLWTVDLKEETPKFEDKGRTNATMGEIFFFKEGTLAGFNFEFDLVEISHTKNKRLAQIGKLIPKHLENPLIDHSNFYTYCFGNSKKKLAVAYSMYQNIFVFDKEGSSNEFKTQSINFPGYLFPEEGAKLKNSGRKGVFEFLNKYHFLQRLAWHRGSLYGLFRFGIEDLGSWVKLEGKASVVWKNAENADNILALSEDEVIMGKHHESENGIVTWELSRRSQIPPYKPFAN